MRVPRNDDIIDEGYEILEIVDFLRIVEGPNEVVKANGVKFGLVIQFILKGAGSWLKGQNVLLLILLLCLEVTEAYPWIICDNILTDVPLLLEPFLIGVIGEDEKLRGQFNLFVFLTHIDWNFASWEYLHVL